MDWMESLLVLSLNFALFSQIAGQVWNPCRLPHLLVLLLFSLNVKLCKEFYRVYLPTYCLSYGGNYGRGSSFFFFFLAIAIPFSLLS